MRRVIIIVLFFVIFLAGLSILLYPTVSDYFNSIKHIQAVDRYLQAVNTLSELDYSDILEAAKEYNERLRGKSNRFMMSEEEFAEYTGLLDPSGLGAMGVLEIEIINIRLPIYHGTDEAVLQAGLGHFIGSSLPIGGLGTHSVITGHRGLPSSMLLTNLDRVVIGDVFKLNVLNEILLYQVDQIKTVEPNDLLELVIVRDKDYCTLLTCTPYGINTHRLLVRGHRVDNEETEDEEHQIYTEARVVNKPIAALLMLIPVTPAVLVILFIRLRRVYGRGKKR